MNVTLRKICTIQYIQVQDYKNSIRPPQKQFTDKIIFHAALKSPMSYVNTIIIIHMTLPCNLALGCR